MTSTASLAATAALVGDPARAGMLSALMDGRALTASELAGVAGIAPQTASGHLARLTEAGLLTMARQGRHRYHRLASPEVARMLESLMAVAATAPGSALRRSRLATGPRDHAMRQARTCYDHLAGRLAVAMAGAMCARGHLEWAETTGTLTAAGTTFLHRLGVDLPERSRARPFCRPCLDWSERRPHIAGSLGAALCHHCLAQGWVRRQAAGRALSITPPGQRALADAFGLRFGPGGLAGGPTAG